MMLTDGRIALVETFILSWQNSSLSIYTYNSNGNLSQTVNQSWNPVTSTWENFTRITNTYNNNNGISEQLTESWNGTAWENDSRITYTYDANNNLTNILDQDWNASTNSWENNFQTNFTYSNDKISQAVTQTWNSQTSTWENESRSTYSYTSSCALPLTLLNFTATKGNNTVSLSWQTANEVNTSHFMIQRSLDATNFTSLGNVTAKGSNATNNYGFTDDITGINNDKIYYRLQMVDKDGKFTYSKIAVVSITLDGKFFVIYPNPVKDQLILTTNSTFSKAEIRINDQNGKLMYKQHLENVQAGMQNMINVSKLVNGVYYLQVITGSDIQTTKFFKY